MDLIFILLGLIIFTIILYKLCDSKKQFILLYLYAIIVSIIYNIFNIEFQLYNYIVGYIFCYIYYMGVK